jgi:hypothetical protein
MFGSFRGFASLIKTKILKSQHSEVLVSKTLGDEMKNVLDDATKMVNFIKQRLFTPECLTNCVKTWTNST